MSLIINDIQTLHDFYHHLIKYNEKFQQHKGFLINPKIFQLKIIFFIQLFLCQYNNKNMKHNMYLIYHIDYQHYIFNKHIIQNRLKQR